MNYYYSMRRRESVFNCIVGLIVFTLAVIAVIIIILIYG